jgi:hypothetical protein
MSSARHPGRSLELAVLFARIQGGAHLVLALLAALVLAGRFDGQHAALEFIMVVAILLPFVVFPALAYMVLASSMARRKQWAVVTVLVLACVHATITIGWPLWMLASDRGVPLFQLFLAGPLLIVACLLIVHCAQALPAVRPPTGRPSGPRGFEVTTFGGAQAKAFPTPPRSLKENSRESE